jgi:hypothetical protein
MTRRQQAIAALAAITVVVAVLVVVAVSRGQGPSPTSLPAYTPAPTSPASPGATPTPTPGTTVPSSRRLADILDDMHLHAFNPAAPPTKGSALGGGLFVNWRGTWDGDLTTASDNTNVQTSGVSDDQTGATPRHDPVTDLMYLRNLRAYMATYPSDHAFDQDAARMEPIVRAEFAGYTYYRSWIYFQMRDLDRFEPGTGWDRMAHAFADAVNRGFYTPAEGTVVDRSHSNYRTDFAAESAAVFADAGARYGEPQLTAAARSTTEHLLAHAQDPRTHLYPLQMGYAGGGDTVQQAQIKVGEQAQLLDSLLTVYDHLRDPRILTAVSQAVDELYSPQLGLWDARNGGFFFSVDADGQGLQTAYKESRQAWVLALLRHLDTEVGGQAQRITAMTSVVVDDLYQKGLDGYVYRLSPTFAVFHTGNGPNHTTVDEDFVTSEAMGIAGNVLAP